MKAKLIHIGPTEEISLSIGEGYAKVPAKVDTGADYSSVWASDISEKDGALSFSLFGVGSKHYTGERIELRDYGLTVVKNSFGQTEQRYKVRLSVTIAGRRIKAEFRLADRSQNRYPVLIGKKTLLKRFVVDVSAHDPRDYKVLVLNSVPSKVNENLFESINQSSVGVQCDFRVYDDFALVMSSEGINVVDLVRNVSLRDYDLIYFKTYFKKAEVATSIAEYAQTYNIAFIDSEVATYHAYTKVSQYAKLARAGVAIPKSIIVSYMMLLDQFAWFESELGLPFILKDAAADKGANNYLIKSQKDFKKVAQQANKQKSYYVAQQFIENDGDYRLIVMNRNVELIIERKAVDSKTHLNNTSTGGSAVLKNSNEMSSALKSLAVKSAIVTHREIAGVDIIEDKRTGDWYVLEVNNSPQLASGAFMNEKINILGKSLKNYAKR